MEYRKYSPQSHILAGLAITYATFMGLAFTYGYFADDINGFIGGDQETRDATGNAMFLADVVLSIAAGGYFGYRFANRVRRSRS